MKILNVMNFVRQCEPRKEGVDHLLFNTTKAELEIVNEYKIDNTFLLQYDVLCDEKYIKLFKENATSQTELGLWYEIVEPLTTACGMPYNSKEGWSWDWHIIPGFSMGYSVEEREKLIDEAMRKFKEAFGYYPATVGSWLIDTHTINYLVEHYHIEALCCCRDQVSTDAYTLLGGYFNQAYYPSKNNVFTPAQTQEGRINVPMFRLLGPSPIQNYDNKKYLSETSRKIGGCWTMELFWYSGYTPEIVDWFFESYYKNEDLGFSYCQIGQENSFGASRDLSKALRMQLDKAVALDGVTFQKMKDTGKWFKETYKDKTPATSVAALRNWDTVDAQSVYYDCQNYTANIFRHNNQIFIRALYLFDERVKDRYLTEKCTRFDALYTNLPIVDTVLATPEKKEDIGLLLDGDATAFTAEKTAEGVLAVKWGDKSVIFSEEGITVCGVDTLTWFKESLQGEVSLQDGVFRFCYEGNAYSFVCEGGIVKETEDAYVIEKDGKDIAFSFIR